MLYHYLSKETLCKFTKKHNTPKAFEGKCYYLSAFCDFYSYGQSILDFVRQAEITISLFLQRKAHKSLEDIVKKLTFAMSKHCFGYAAECGE